MIQAKDVNRLRKVPPLPRHTVNVPPSLAPDEWMGDTIAPTEAEMREITYRQRLAYNNEMLAIRYPSNDAAKIGGVWVFWAGVLFGIGISVGGFAAAMLVWSLS